ncbi:MAG: hypothetical protein A2075_06215 [Geobacteraceae bacterium GWC2_58_44]|nr:MAG: hypothetical protein A2075_06215 [Geobacteraceae bacterium GWC2_58_44]HBG05758.1 hypothetical protein [Geobacter sp.]
MTIILYISFPILCFLAIPQSSRPGALAERMVFGIALHEFLLLVIGLTLGLTSHLTSQSYTILTSCAAIPLAVQSWKNGIRINPTHLFRWLWTRRGATALLLAVIMSVTFALQLGFDALYGTRHFDGLLYHIPRVVFWLQQGNFDAWPTPTWGHIGPPVGADVILGQNILLGNGWRGVGFVTCLLSVGAIACVYIAALDFRLSRWRAAIVAILFSSFPAIGLRIWSVNSDMVAAFPVLASYIALHRLRDVKFGLAIFVVLNGIAVACKPTVAPLALLLGGFALWQCRQRIFNLRSFALPCAATVMAAAFVISSYWPVYVIFADIQGGEFGRAHKVGSFIEFTQAVAMNTGHWMLEPLGYLAPIMKSTITGIAETVYRSLGAHFNELPDGWNPWPAQDISRTGLVSILLLPGLLVGLPSRARMPATILFLAGFVSLSGLLRFTPFTARYTIVLLAGYALLWGGTRFFQRGNRRWILTGIVALNVFALLGVVSIRFYVDKTKRSQPGGIFYYLSNQDRNTIAHDLTGRPLQVISGDALDALLVGPDIDFSLRHILCPSDGDCSQELRNASLISNWLAIVHNGDKVIRIDEKWQGPTGKMCSEISIPVLEDTLTKTGWHLYRHNHLVDLWNYR